VFPVSTLEEYDGDGALREAAAGCGSRADVVRRAAALGAGLAGAVVGFGALAAPARAATTNDLAILNFLLTLEYLEADFYQEAVTRRALRNPGLVRFAAVVRAQERAHVRFLRQALGSAAARKPRFDFRGVTGDPERFQATATSLAETVARAYASQVLRIDAPEVVKAAVALQTVEARHAAWIRKLRGLEPAPEAFERPLARAEALAAVKKTRFVVSSVSRV
jgi:hypothetical protein